MNKEVEKKTDYSVNNRPKTRLKQFFDIFTHRFVELMKISLLQTVFNMPLIATMVVFYALVRNATDLNALMMVYIITGVSVSISLMSSFVGMCGTFYCMKKLIYAEGEFASSSFFIGLREEWRKGIAIGLIIGASSALTIIGSFFFYFYLSSRDAIVSGFGIAILVIQSIVLFMVGYHSIAQTVIYSNNLKYVIKNSFIMTLLRFPINLLLIVIHPGILVALVNIMEITMYVAIILLIIFVTFGHLIWMLNCVAACDKFINKENYPEYYKKGLSKEA